MPSYSISAPDGQTYKIDGPEGATQEQIQAEVLRQHPTAGTPTAPTTPASPSTIGAHPGKVPFFGADVTIAPNAEQPNGPTPQIKPLTSLPDEAGVRDLAGRALTLGAGAGLGGGLAAGASRLAGILPRLLPALGEGAGAGVTQGVQTPGSLADRAKSAGETALGTLAAMGILRGVAGPVKALANKIGLNVLPKPAFDPAVSGEAAGASSGPAAGGSPTSPLQEILQRNSQPTSIPALTPTPPPFKLPEGYTARDFARLSPEAQAELRNPPLPGILSPAPTTSVPPTPGAPRPFVPSSEPYRPDPEIAAMKARRAALASGQSSGSAGASGQGPSIAPTLQARGIVSGGPVPDQPPAAVSSTWTGSYPPRVPPAASPTVADLPMTRVHGPGEQIQNIGPPGPGKPTIRVVNPPTLQPSGTAELVRQDPILRSALEASQHWRQMHGKGFAEGGKVRTPQQEQDERDYQDALRQSKGQSAPAPAQPAPQPAPSDEDAIKAQIYKKPPPNTGGYFKYPWSK